VDPVLELRGVAKRYPGFSLRDVSFALPRGYVCGLIGPNGAGKTTIVKMILGLVRAGAGTLRVFGRRSGGGRGRGEGPDRVRPRGAGLRPITSM